MARQLLRSQGGRWAARYLWPSGRTYMVRGQDVVKIPEAYSSCCVELYSNRSDAAARRSIAGRGFLVEAPVNAINQSELYVVTAAPVIRMRIEGNSPVVRIDSQGHFQLIDTSLESWQMSDEIGPAIAVLPSRPREGSCVPIPREAFSAPECIQPQGFAVGHSIFLTPGPVGLETEKTGNPPLVFGTITSTRDACPDAKRRKQNAIEAVSVKFPSECGQPGSPVFLCEQPHNLHFGGIHDRAWKLGPKLLGIYMGEREGLRQFRSQDTASPDDATNEASMPESLVAPVWKLSALLELSREYTFSSIQ